jgi:phosphoribosylglycinamide formyltransferase-1
MNNIIVLFSGKGNTLKSIIDHCIEAKVICTITNNANALGIHKSNTAGIPCKVVEQGTLNKKQYSTVLQHEIDDCINMFGDIKYIVLAGFMVILSDEIITYFNNKHIKIINIHPSLLPKYPGLHTHNHVIENNDNIHGITIHYVDKYVDHGEVIQQCEIDVDGDSIHTLDERIKQIEQIMYPTCIDYLCVVG